MKNFFKKYSIQLKILFALTIGLVIITIALYFLIPLILNYPTGTWATAFQTELENTVYWQQVLLIAFAIFSIFASTIFTKTHFLVNNYDLINNPNNYTEKEINVLKEKLYNVPYSIFLLNIILPCISVTTIHSFTIHQLNITTFKMFILVFSFSNLFVTTIFIYTNKLFKKILLHLPITDIHNIKKTSITRRIIFHIFPIFIASLLFVTLLGYSKTAIEKGNSSFEAYNKSLYYFSKYNSFSSLEELIENRKQSFELVNSSDLFFIQLPNGEFIDSNYNNLTFSDFFIKYLKELSIQNNGRVYEYYGIDAQAATSEIDINGQKYIIGVYFNILSFDVFRYFFIVFAILLIIDTIILVIFSHSFKYDINVISDNFNKMADNVNNVENHSLIATTNDEIGELCSSYNSIQELTKSQQSMLVEKERLATLGQMMGGIAHNLNTPIFSISGGLEGLNDLIEEFDSSIEDSKVNDDDLHAIAYDMRTWTSKLENYVSYMSDVITAVKGQAITLSESEVFTFNTEDLLKQVSILMKNALDKALITLNISNNVPNDLYMKGNINSLVQVINNIIFNAIDACDNSQNTHIDLSVSEKNNKIIITIQDYGYGIPKDIQQKLFKEMITTKGKNGTGLGLFMSYSTIRAQFNGEIYFTSDLDVGTTFIIKIPGCRYYLHNNKHRKNF